MTLKTIALAYVGALVLASYIGAGGAKASDLKPGACGGIGKTVALIECAVLIEGTASTKGVGLETATVAKQRFLPSER